MFNNLKAEFIKIGIKPHIGVSNTLKCSERAARNRLNGSTAFTIFEAVKIKEEYFSNITIDYLFAVDKKLMQGSET